MYFTSGTSSQLAQDSISSRLTSLVESMAEQIREGENEGPRKFWRDVICLFMYPPIVLTNKKSTVCLHTTVRLGLLFAVLVLFSYIPNKIRRGPRTTNSLLSSILHTFYVILQFGGIPKLTANFRLWVAERYSADVRSELNLLIRFRLWISIQMVFVAITLQWWINVVHVPLPWQLYHFLFS